MGGAQLGSIYVASEWTDYTPLRDALDAEALPVDVRLRVAKDLAKAMEWLHCGTSPPVPHLDLNSFNVLVNPSEPDCLIKVPRVSLNPCRCATYRHLGPLSGGGANNQKARNRIPTRSGGCYSAMATQIARRLSHPAQVTDYGFPILKKLSRNPEKVRKAAEKLKAKHNPRPKKKSKKFRPVPMGPGGAPAAVPLRPSSSRSRRKPSSRRDSMCSAVSASGESDAGSDTSDLFSTVTVEPLTQQSSHSSVVPVQPPSPSVRSEADGRDDATTDTREPALRVRVPRTSQVSSVSSQATSPVGTPTSADRKRRDGLTSPSVKVSGTVWSAPFGGV